MHQTEQARLLLARIDCADPTFYRRSNLLDLLNPFDSTPALQKQAMASSILEERNLQDIDFLNGALLNEDCGDIRCVSQG